MSNSTELNFPPLTMLPLLSHADNRKSFTLPPDVTCQHHTIGKKGKKYTFRHAEWGEIGRIDVLSHENQSQITSYAVAGDPRDPLTELRNALFRTIANMTAKFIKHRSSSIFFKKGITCHSFHSKYQKTSI